jgi:hypothetical protein
MVRTLIVIVTSIILIGCDRPSSRPANKQIPTFNGKTRVLAISFELTGMTQIGYISDRYLQPTGMGGTIGNFEGDIVVSVLETNQTSWLLQFACSGTATQNQSQKVEMTNVVRTPFPGPTGFSLPHGIKGTTWFLSDTEVLEFYIEHPETRGSSKNKVD